MRFITSPVEEDSPSRHHLTKPLPRLPPNSPPPRGARLYKHANAPFVMKGPVPPRMVIETVAMVPEPLFSPDRYQTRTGVPPDLDNRMKVLTLEGAALSFVSEPASHRGKDPFMQGTGDNGQQMGQFLDELTTAEKTSAWKQEHEHDVDEEDYRDDHWFEQAVPPYASLSSPFDPTPPFGGRSYFEEFDDDGQDFAAEASSASSATPVGPNLAAPFNPTYPGLPCEPPCLNGPAKVDHDWDMLAGGLPGAAETADRFHAADQLEKGCADDWPGHENSTDPTEMSGFLPADNLDCDQVSPSTFYRACPGLLYRTRK